MTRIRLGRRKSSTIAVLLVLGIAFLMLSFGVPSAAALTAAPEPPVTIIVPPSGGDDTQNLQTAFNICASVSDVCNVELVKGIYHITPISVVGFHGSFIGAGQALTFVQPYLRLPPVAPVHPVVASGAGKPNSATPGPWPAMLTFVNAKIRIAEMTIRDPFGSPVAGAIPEPMLGAGIAFSGEIAQVSIVRVSVIGAKLDLGTGYDLAAAIEFQGTAPPPGPSPDEAAGIPLSGVLKVVHSVLQDTATGLLIANVAGLEATVRDNSMSAEQVAMLFQDLSSSAILVRGNDVSSRAGYFSLEAMQEFGQYGLLPSVVSVVGNDFLLGGGASAVRLQDGAPFEGGQPSLSALVAGNVISTVPSPVVAESGGPAIVAQNLASLEVDHNTIRGGGAGMLIMGSPGWIMSNTLLGALDGVELTGTSYQHVVGNVVLNSRDWGIALTDGSSYNLVEGNTVLHSMVYDLYWDGTGTGNVWIGNHCGTSGPGGLCEITTA